VAVSEQISRLFGLHAPVKIIEQQLRVSYRKTESKIHISFDRSPIEALARQPVAGLTITANSETIGNGTKQLHYTDPLPLAGEIPRD
jgi:predicted ATPase